MDIDHSNYIFFCSHDMNKYKNNKYRAVFSQWRHSTFTDDKGISYNSAEQYMMYQKSLLMDDLEIAKKILSIDIYDESCNSESKVIFSSIAQIKKLGRKIKNFDQNKWNSNKLEIVKKGNYLKFSQNSDLKNILLQTDDKILAEAASYDNIWGIGLSESQALVTDPEYYGENLLGKALMWTRSEIQK